MIIWRCLDSLVVLAAFAAVYFMPTYLLAKRCLPSTDRATLFTVSAGLGLASQALLGFVWNHLPVHAPAMEACAYFIFWLIVSLTLLWRPEKNPTLDPGLTTRDSSPPFLSLILLAAILLRSFDALDHASLGQSDAYTHLQFLRDVIQHGQIRNIVYPPGYSWVLALPTLTFNLDAYLVGRYVGPFFGALMVAALYLLGCKHHRITGLVAAFSAAVCPLLYPLVKTGMGAFANQLGLFLLPLALLLYLGNVRFLFTLIVLGLAASVPLLVFSLALIIGIHRLLCYSASQPWWRKSLWLLIPFALALILAGYQFLSPGKLHLNTTATLVTGISTPSLKKHASAAAKPPTLLKKLKTNPAGKLAVDLFTVKRWGLGSSLMNLAILALVALFTGILAAGFRQRSDILKLTGCWGLLTTLQAATGLLEFSLYQRSGWILLQAVALAAGIISALLLQAERLKKIIRLGVGSGLLASLLLAFWLPPQHRPITSGAENELAAVLRELSAARINALNTRGPLSWERPQASPLILRAAAAPKLAVITRRYTQFNADQGNLADVLPDPAARLLHIPVEKDTRLTPWCAPFICLVDRYTGLPDMGLLERISPALTHSLSGFQPMLYQPNEVILSFLNALPPDTWQVVQEDRGKNLSVYFVEQK